MDMLAGTLSYAERGVRVVVMPINSPQSLLFALMSLPCTPPVNPQYRGSQEANVGLTR